MRPVNYKRLIDWLADTILIHMPNKYAQIAQAELDLHQMTRLEAEAALKDFLEASTKAKHALVCIVTGKGLHSKTGPVLGEAIRLYLDKHGYEYKNAKLNEGAIEVRL